MTLGLQFAHLCRLAAPAGQRYLAKVVPRRPRTTSTDDRGLFWPTCLREVHRDKKGDALLVPLSELRGWMQIFAQLFLCLGPNCGDAATSLWATCLQHPIQPKLPKHNAANRNPQTLFQHMFHPCCCCISYQRYFCRDRSGCSGLMCGPCGPSWSTLASLSVQQCHGSLSSSLTVKVSLQHLQRSLRD
jgi:hypothetical protein